MTGADERRCTGECLAELAEADVIALNTDGEIRAARGATAAGQPMIAFSGGVIDTDTLYHENMHQWWGTTPARAATGSLRPGHEASVSAEMTPARWLLEQQVMVQRLGLSTCSFYRTGSAYALVMSQQTFGGAVAGCTVRAGSKRRSGWRSMAPPAPMTTIPNRPETANPRKITGTVANSPRKCAAGRNTTKNCAPPICRWPRPMVALTVLRWTRCTLRRNAPGTSSTGIAGAAGTGTGQASPGKRNSPPSWDDEKIIGHVLSVARAPDDPPVFQANRRWRVHGSRQ